MIDTTGSAWATIVARAPPVATIRRPLRGEEAAAKKRGWVRQEGKVYVVQDGDVLHVLFNV